MDPNEIYVAFTDENETAIETIFAGPQDTTFWKYQGVVTSADSRYVSYYDTQPDFAKAFLPTPTTASTTSTS